MNSRDPGRLDVGGELAGSVLEPGEAARLRAALDAAADREPPR